MTVTKSLQALIIAALSTVLCMQAPLARAEPIATDQVAAPSAAEQDRAKVEAFLERADVRQKLSLMGVDGLAANDRVAALSDAEVHTLWKTG
ncbi:MAG TPA: PA2779 family protein [Thiobacillus sp.]